MNDEAQKLAQGMMNGHKPTEEEKAEMNEIWRQHYQRNYGMTPEEFAALEPEVMIAMMQKAGVEFAASFGGKKVEGKRRDPLDPPLLEN